jgi:hypothetical protein
MELRELRDQVARLQGKIHARRLRALVPWVDALLGRIEARLERVEQREEMR